MSGLSIQVRTRSKVLDYRFVGAAAPERWWEKSYGPWTDFARPTILVEADRFFVSGIVSGRTDSKGTRIHYALHGEVGPEARDVAARALAHLCRVRGRTGSLEEAGLQLDRFGEELWTAAVQGEPEAVRRIDAKVAEWLATLDEAAVAAQAPGRSWVREPDEDAFEQLAATAAAVLAAQPGAPRRAVYLNLASSSELRDLERIGAGIVCREVDRRPKSLRPAGRQSSSRSPDCC